jgi:protein arginine kinase
VGTGIRASVMLHLPGLVLMEEMEPVMNGISKIGLAVRGMWGEGTDSAGNMFQISNQITLGRSEKEIVEHLEQIVAELIDHEKNARERLLQDRTIVIKDQVARALGILSCARLITSSEALDLLSMLRLGYNLGVVVDFDRADLDELFIAIQPAHLQKKKKKTMSSLERDTFRADVLRTFMDKNRLSKKNKMGIKNG